MNRKKLIRTLKWRKSRHGLVLSIEDERDRGEITYQSNGSNRMWKFQMELLSCFIWRILDFNPSADVPEESHDSALLLCFVKCLNVLLSFSVL